MANQPTTQEELITTTKIVTDDPVEAGTKTVELPTGPTRGNGSLLSLGNPAKSTASSLGWILTRGVPRSSGPGQ